MLPACPPMASTQPAITSSTAAGSTSARTSSPRHARAPKSTGCIPASAPLRLPTAVRTTSMTYASVICVAPLPRKREVPPHRFVPLAAARPGVPPLHPRPRASRGTLLPVLEPRGVFVAVVCAEPGVDLDARGQPPPDGQDPDAGHDLTRDAAFHADGRDRLPRHPKRFGANAFQQNPLGIAGQHGL